MIAFAKWVSIGCIVASLSNDLFQFIGGMVFLLFAAAFGYAEKCLEGKKGTENG